MTDIMKLADDYAECMYLRREKHEARAALQSAIEALQAENERLKAQWAEWSDSLNSVMKQRNALRAQLEEMQRQAPVALEDEMLDTAISWCDSNGINVLGLEELSSLIQSLCITVRDTSPKALEPLTDERIDELEDAAFRDYMEGRIDCYTYAVARAIEAAHGIFGVSK